MTSEDGMEDGPDDEEAADDDPEDVGVAETRPAQLVRLQVGNEELGFGQF